MHTTLKLAATITDIPFQREYSAIFRYAYERKYEQPAVKEKVILDQIRIKWPDINSWLQNCSMKAAIGQVDAHKAQELTGQRKSKVVWGGKKNFHKLMNKEISKEEFKKLKLQPVISQGEIAQKSNRLFDLTHLLEDQPFIIYKPNRDTHIKIDIDKSHLANRKHRHELQYLTDNIGKMPITVLIKENQVCLSYEAEVVTATKAQIAKEKLTAKVKKDPIKNRILGIDLNPGEIGVTIVDFDPIKKTETVVFAIDYQISKEVKSNDNKRNHETAQIAHDIITKAVHFQVESLGIEILTMGAKDAGKGKVFNRLCNNQWNRVQFQWLMRKLCYQNRINFKEVNAAYSSTIGNVLHHGKLPDPCCAAWEIARRVHCFGKKGICLYPVVKFSEIDYLRQWKDVDDLFSGTEPWKEIHQAIKENPEIKLRVPLGAFARDSLDFKSRRSGIVIHTNFTTLH